MPREVKEATRSWRAGQQLGIAVIESINLMYQNRTASNYLDGLIYALNRERKRRKG